MLFSESFGMILTTQEEKLLSCLKYFLFLEVYTLLL